VILLLVASWNAQGQQQPVALRGTLSYNERPITEAAVFLQSLRNESCATLFRTADVRDDSRALKRLEHCIHDEGSTMVDSQGQYRLSPKKTGWYVLHFLWDIQPKPAQPCSFTVNTWTAGFEGKKDLTGKYDAMAQGAPVFFSGTGDVFQDFDYRGPSDRPISTQARISIPGVVGVLELEVGPTAWQSKVRDDGNEVQLYAMGRPDNLLLSAFLQRVPFVASPEQCRLNWWPRTATSAPMEREGLREFEKQGIAMVDYIVPRFRGNEVRQKSVHAYLGNGDICAEVHLSKVQFVSENQKLFDDVISTVQLIPNEVATPVSASSH
jgi:hypothetical protein